MVRTTRMMVIAVATLALAATAGGPIRAQGKGGKPKPPSAPSSYPGTLTFRCVVGACADGLIGDGSDYLGGGDPETGYGAHLKTSSGELWLGFGNAAYEITIDLGDRLSTLCGEPGEPACRWPWPMSTWTINSGEIQSNVVDGPTGAEVAGGLLSIDPGAIGWARLKVNFAGPVGSYLYLLNFNGTDDEGATAVEVERGTVAEGTECTWVFNGDNATAMLKSGVRKNLVKEGLFYMPFEITFTAPGCMGS